MTPERWQQINELFRSALDLEPKGRSAFLAQSCAEDDPLRLEVETLIASHDQSENFMETPAFEAAAEMLVGDQVEPLAGQRIGPYQIVALLGEGGMGEVYLAEDVKLGRQMALKLLPAYFGKDEDRLRRFAQEARAASALNHPNVCVIYEVDETEDGRHYIAMEYVDGETLCQVMTSRRMTLDEVLEVAVQVASGLAAAHQVGIVHRDIKPENIMLRRDGYVKVLDFGLAKLTEQPTNDVTASSGARVKTDTGVVMGTSRYMSPEQARGLAVDARTDIWSLGVALYEMVTGRVPFDGPTTSDVIVSILEREPPPLAQLSPDAPAELQRIITKALHKDREERYQTAQDLLSDLRNLKKKLDVNAEIERTVPPELISATSGAQDVTSHSLPATAAQRAAQTATVERGRATSSVEYLVGKIRRHKRSVSIALAALTIAIAGVAYVLFPFRGVKALDSIAVMPFVNASGDGDTEYLSDGISEALINSLTELRQLKVIARSTAFRYKGRDVDPQTVGRELNVRAVLTGRVRQAGDTLNVQVDLVDATTGAQLWGEEYERKVSDVLAVKQSIAREVTEKLRLRLSSEEERRLVGSTTTNADAYHFYLRGRYFWNKRTADGLKSAIVEFQQAIDRDPNYALGYVGLADSYNVLGFYSFLPPKESFPKAKAVARKALELDENLAEAHNSLAYAVLYFDWDFATAEKGFIRAIELNPNYPIAHQWYGNLLTAMGRWDEAVQEFKRAQELDPLSLVIIAVPGWTYYYARQYDRAVEHCQNAIDMDRNFALAHEWLGQVYERKAMYERAITEFKEALRLSGGSPEVEALLAHAYAVSGSKRQAQVILDDLIELSKRRYVSPYHIATIYVGLADDDRALKWLNTAYNDRENTLVFLKYDARLDNLRSDPRFDELLRRVGLPK